MPYLFDISSSGLVKKNTLVKIGDFLGCRTNRSKCDQKSH